MVPEYGVWKLGESVQHRPLDACVIAPRTAQAAVPVIPGPAPWPSVLVLGAVHGDEIEGVWLVEEMRSRWTREYPFERMGVVVWAQVNPDGVAAGSRWNANGVDLNRNLPSRDWTPEAKNPRYPPGPQAASEPENRALVKLLQIVRPAAIVSVHSFAQYQVNVNGVGEALMEWGGRLAGLCGYPITEDIGYPTPGSLGTYAGKELQIPTITLEVERGLAKEKVLELHVPVLEEAVRFWDSRGGVTP